MVDYSKIDMNTLDEVTSNSRTRYNPITNPYGTNWIEGSGSPVSSAPGATVTITAANLLTGIITFSPTTGCTATFDTAANIITAINNNSAGAFVGDYISCLIINGNGTNAITLAADASGSFDTNQATRTIPVNTSKLVLIRISNVTPGSQAYVIYF
jgi:hypothetical protein